jgi:large subunit ribosomal protein L23
MKSPQDVIQAPLISEKGTQLTESANQVLFKVQVVQVRMARYLGKVRRIGRNMGRRSDWKKAYVTLKDGDKIDFFGGA